MATWFSVNLRRRRRTWPKGMLCFMREFGKSVVVIKNYLKVRYWGQIVFSRMGWINGVVIVFWTIMKCQWRRPFPSKRYFPNTLQKNVSTVKIFYFEFFLFAPIVKWKFQPSLQYFCSLFLGEWENPKILLEIIVLVYYTVHTLFPKFKKQIYLWDSSICVISYRMYYIIKIFYEFGIFSFIIHGIDFLDIKLLNVFSRVWIQILRGNIKVIV